MRATIVVIALLTIAVLVYAAVGAPQEAAIEVEGPPLVVGDSDTDLALRESRRRQRELEQRIEQLESNGGTASEGQGSVAEVPVVTVEGVEEAADATRANVTTVVSELEHLMATSAVDRSRSDRIALEIGEVLSTRPEFAGVALEDVECAGDLCRASFGHHDERSAAVLRASTNALFAWAATGFTSAEQDRTVVYATDGDIMSLSQP